ncbi:ATP synthase subunit alpha [bioreactor metagenome]|uniref:ATP synthase subunit alpha n=1 Tax=bioreactor metagenome TaxID=1076179 RepID=A0A645GE24_9ZZZZ
MEILKQPQYAPVKVEHQVMIIYAATNRYLADVPVEEIKDFEKGLYEFMDTHYPEVGKAIKSTGKLEPETEEQLKAAILKFKSTRIKG